MRKQTKSEDGDGIFTRITDSVSYGMGTPANIIVWILMVLAWFAYGIFFVPGWFTSNRWNFPLNTITTLAELYIGFLVGAAANRSERNMKKIVSHTDEVVTRFEKIELSQTDMEQKIYDMERKILDAISKK